jgi:hypothetical protein
LIYSAKENKEEIQGHKCPFWTIQEHISIMCYLCIHVCSNFQKCLLMMNIKFRTIVVTLWEVIKSDISECFKRIIIILTMEAWYWGLKGLRVEHRSFYIMYILLKHILHILQLSTLMYLILFLKIAGKMFRFSLTNLEFFFKYS